MDYAAHKPGDKIVFEYWYLVLTSTPNPFPGHCIHGAVCGTPFLDFTDRLKNLARLMPSSVLVLPNTTLVVLQRVKDADKTYLQLSTLKGDVGWAFMCEGMYPINLDLE